MKALIILVFLVLGGTAIMQVSLSYADKATLISMLDDVDRIDDLSRKNKKEIKDIIVGKSISHKIDNITPEAIQLDINRSSGYVDVSYNYSVRISLIPKFPQMGFDIEMSSEPKRLND